ncbi:MAG: hypothetical protein GQ474_03190, partial [Sulfurimonas sp.]|nr:hypothetical protein [Sulfurimonas sp.]
MSLNIFKTTSLSLSLLFVIGCGSGGDSNSVTGTFIDSAVSGLTYNCAPSGGSGVTNAKGEFTCTKGDNVSFKLGGVPLGVTVSVDTKVITPYALFPDN